VFLQYIYIVLPKTEILNDLDKNFHKLKFKFIIRLNLFLCSLILEKFRTSFLLLNFTLFIIKFLLLF